MLQNKREHTRRGKSRRVNIAEGPDALIAIFGIQKDRRKKERRVNVRRSDLISHSLINDTVIVTASKNLDLDFEDNLRKKLEWTLGSGISKIVLDLTKSIAITERQITCLSEIRRKCLDTGGDLVLAGAGEIVVNALYHSETSEDFAMYPTADDALKAFEQAT